MRPRRARLGAVLSSVLLVCARGQDATQPTTTPAAQSVGPSGASSAPQGASGAAASIRADSGTSQACPDINPMRSLALGYWYTTWGKMQCGHTFEEESLGISVRDVQDQPAQCEVVLYRPAGDLRVRVVPSSGSVVAAWVRPPERRGASGWRTVDRRVCLLSSMLGAAPWIEPIPPEIVQAAYDDLVAARQRSAVAQRMCGQALSLVATQGINGIVELTAQKVERQFFLEVLEGGVTSTVIPVQVLVEESQRVNPENNGTQKAYRLLSSTPSACQIAASMPFAAFGCAASAAGPNGGAAAIARRLEEVQDRASLLQQGPCEAPTREAVPMQELRDISEAQNNCSDLGEWRAELGPLALYHERVGPETFERTHLGDQTASETLRAGGSSDVREAASKRLVLAVARHLQAVTGDHRFPDSYDLRRNFPRCSQPARATGQCSASWAFAAVGAFEKQLCRLSGGQISEVLSRQRVMDCASTARGCAGGSVFDAHAAMLVADSVVTESCYSYAGGFDAGSAAGAPGSAPQSCPPVDPSCGGRYAARFPSPAEVAYQTRLASTMPGAAATNVLVGEKAMQAAILLYGAVVASFAVYPEFLAYRSGIYRARQFNEQTRLGTHAVQLVGWGAAPASGDKYWIAENSWGAWGENQDFQRCSVVDCRGRLCAAADNLNPNCADSAVWQDAFGNGCDWYRAYDPGCEVYPDGGQMTQCRRACRNCLPPPARNGEMCGFFRIVRGSNHLGIESFATHTYVAGQAPPADLFSDLAPTCEDDATWLDGWGSGCAWYQTNDPGCVKFQDYGQQEFCRRTCQTCPLQLAQAAPPLSQRNSAGSCGGAVAAALAVGASTLTATRFRESRR